MSLDFAQPELRNLGRVLQAYAEHTPDHVYLRADERRLTFRETNQLVNRFAAGLKDLGLGRGERVAIYMRPCIEFVALVLAVNKLGAIWTPINTDYKNTWLRDALNDSRPAIVVTDQALLPAVLEAESEAGTRNYRLICDGDAAQLSRDITSLSSFLVLSDADHDLSEIHYGDTAAILWTSGTTGKPKGVMQSHNAWLRSCESGNRMTGTRPGDVAYNCLPLYNSAAWVSNIFRALHAGITCAMDPQFSVSNFWDRIRYYGATQTLTLGAMHMFLWNAPPRPDDADNPLRVAYMIPMPDAIMEPFSKRFGIEKILQGYGQSEIMAFVVRANEAGITWKPNALGTVVTDLELKLLDDTGNEVPPGSPGEFCVKPLAPFAIFNGYFDQPEITRNSFSGDWYRTGDLGLRDADGDLFFVDRKKDVIRYKGRSISSLQIESIAQRHPAVASAAAFGIPSEELSSEHEIKLDVICKSGQGVTPAELARFINDNAPYFLVPRYIELVEELPYTPTNKIEKYKLRSRGVGPSTWDRTQEDFELKR
jgi:crotonobetaine/carnitine-CoA ligase